MINPTPPYARVLLVDDDSFLLHIYASKFEKRGYQVHAALSVDEALKPVRAGEQFDALIFDIIMPQKTGYAFLEELSRDKLLPRAVKVALTNQSDPEEMRRAKEMGVDLYLVKAMLIPSDVVNKVEEELRLHVSTS